MSPDKSIHPGFWFFAGMWFGAVLSFPDVRVYVAIGALFLAGILAMYWIGQSDAKSEKEAS